MEQKNYHYLFYIIAVCAGAISIALFAVDENDFGICFLLCCLILFVIGLVIHVVQIQNLSSECKHYNSRRKPLTVDEELSRMRAELGIKDPSVSHEQEPFSDEEDPDMDEISDLDPDDLTDWLYYVKHHSVQNSDAGFLAFSLFAIPTLFASKLKKIGTNSHALIDIAIFSFFHSRILLCSRCSYSFVRETERNFYIVFPIFCSEKLGIEENIVAKMLDNRFDKYEELMQNQSYEKEILETLKSFVAKDFLGDPLTPSIALLPADEMFMIYYEIIYLFTRINEGIESYQEILEKYPM